MLYVIFPIRHINCEQDYQGFNAVQVIEFRLRQINHPHSPLPANLTFSVRTEIIKISLTKFSAEAI